MNSTLTESLDALFEHDNNEPCFISEIIRVLEEATSWYLTFDTNYYEMYRFNTIEELHSHVTKINESSETVFLSQYVFSWNTSLLLDDC